jgi:transcriptional regulator with XRE-family HTH domain
MSADPAATVTGPVIPEWTFADRLRKIRRHLGMSQAEIAEELGTNQRTYASWESENSAPRNPVTVAKRIEALSRVPAAWVLGVESTLPTSRENPHGASDKDPVTGRVSPWYRGDIAPVVPLFPQVKTPECLAQGRLSESISA